MYSLCTKMYMYLVMYTCTSCNCTYIISEASLNNNCIRVDACCATCSKNLSLYNISKTFLCSKKSLTGQETFASGAGAGVTHAELETMKQEILSEMRKEIQQAKVDIIEGMISGSGGSQ